MAMKVILLAAVKGVGRIDEVKEVSEGYARNFLFPNHLAVPADQKKLQAVQGKHAREAKEVAGELAVEQKLASRLDGFELEIVDKVSPSGKLFAAITPVRVADGLRKSGFSVKKEQIQMKSIKEPGTYAVTVVFKHGIEASLTLHVLVS